MRNCCVPFCRNRGTIEGIAYFRITHERRWLWLQALNRQQDEDISPDTSVCSEHFIGTDFIIKNNKRTLKRYAVPSIKLRPSSRKQLFQKVVAKAWKEPVEEQDVFAVPSASKDSGVVPKIKEEAYQLGMPGVSKKLIEEQNGMAVPSTSNGSDVVPENVEGTEQNGVNVKPLETAETLKREQPPSSDNKGLNGSAKKRRHLARLIRLMHNYSKSPRKVSPTVSDLQARRRNLQSVIQRQRKKVVRLKKSVTHLEQVVQELKRSRMTKAWGYVSFK